MSIVKSQKKLFIPMTKYDAEKGIAYGVAASGTLDRSNEIFDYATSKPHFEKWSAAAVAATAGKSYGNLRSMHGQIAAGKLESINFNDDDELIEIAAKVVDPGERAKCEEGVYTGFSMGGAYAKKWKDGDATRYTAIPYEVSLVDLPCIPDATFEYVKGAATELRKFHVPTIDPIAMADAASPSNEDVAVKAQELAKAAGRDDKWADYFPAARAELVKGAAAPDDLEPQNVLDIAVTAIDEPGLAKAAAGDEGWSQAWIHDRLPGQTFAKKADLKAALTALDADEAVAKLAAPAADAMKALTAELDIKDPAGAKKNASDNLDLADKDKKTGDKTKPDPKAKAKTPADVKRAKDEADKGKAPMKSAVDVISRAKVLLDEAIPSFVERREILKAAGEFDAIRVLPDGFIDTEEQPLAKSAKPELLKAATLYSVSNLISLVSQLESFHTRLATDPSGSYYYDSGSDITKVEVAPELMTAIGDMCDQLGEKAAQLLDQVLSAMKSETAEKALGRGMALGGLHKVGARNSAADKTRLTKAHDLLAEIDPEMCGAEKHASADLTKALTARDEAFSKSFGDLAAMMTDVAKRVKNIEAQPIPGRPSHVNVVEKGSEIEKALGAATGEDSHAALVEMQADRNRLTFATMTAR